MDCEIHGVLTKAEKAGARFALLHADDEFCQHHLFGMLSFFSGCCLSFWDSVFPSVCASNFFDLYVGSPFSSLDPLLCLCANTMLF